MSVGGQGVISVAGNEIPGELARMVEAVERNDWAAAAPCTTATCR